MLKKELYSYNKKLKENMYKIYSDEEYLIKQLETGNIYEEAIDLESQNYTYEETLKKIEKFEEYIEN